MTGLRCGACQRGRLRLQGWERGRECHACDRCGHCGLVLDCPACERRGLRETAARGHWECGSCGLRREVCACGRGWRPQPDLAACTHCYPPTTTPT